MNFFKKLRWMWKRIKTYVSVYWRVNFDRLRRAIKVALNHYPKTDEWYAAKVRTWAHAIDKGLERSDWSPHHSKQLRRDLEHAFNKLEANHYNDVTIQWAKRIVQTYDKRHQLVTSGQSLPSQSAGSFCEERPSAIAPETFIHFLEQRTSCRNFLDQPVEKSSIETIARGAQQAAWSCNRQMLNIYASTAPATIDQASQQFHGFTCFSGTPPAFLVFAVDLRPYTMPDELFTPTLDSGLGIQNAVLTAASLGLAVTLLNWGAHTRKQEDNLHLILDIPEEYQIVVGAAVGYPSRLPHKPDRRPLKDVLFIR